MKAYTLILTAILMLTMNLLPADSVETVVLNRVGKDYVEKLVDNEIFAKEIRDVEFDNGSLYLLERHFSTVFRINLDTGKLEKTYFKRGQGPNEIQDGRALKIKNGKIFVLDNGFGGLKIVGLDGKPVNEFKTITSGAAMRNFDVSDKDEIFVAEYDSKTQTYVSVYNMEGKRLNALITIPSDSDRSFLQRYHYMIRLDNQGNIVLLFNVLKELKKFNGKGELIWQTKLKNRLLDKYSKNDKISIDKKRGTINTTLSVFDFNVTEGNNILVGHSGGASLLDSAGVLKKLVTFEPPSMLFLFEIIDRRIMEIGLFGSKIFLYNMEEKIK